MSGLSVKRVVVGAIGAIGAYLFLVLVAGLAKFETSWLPYAAELVGALIAGGALARQGTRHRFEALVAGTLSVLIIGTVAFASPSTFGWVAVRAAYPWPTAVALAIGCGASGQAGAWLAYGRGGLPSIVMLSTAVTSGLLLFGGRIVTSLAAHVMTVGSSTGMAILYVCALLAGYAVQSVVPLANAGACASGAAILIGLNVVATEMKGQHTGGLLWLLLAVAAAFAGAVAAQALRSKPHEDAASASDAR